MGSKASWPAPLAHIAFQLSGERLPYQADNPICFQSRHRCIDRRSPFAARVGSTPLTGTPPPPTRRHRKDEPVTAMHAASTPRYFNSSGLISILKFQMWYINSTSGPSSTYRRGPVLIPDITGVHRTNPVPPVFWVIWHNHDTGSTTGNGTASVLSPRLVRGYILAP